MISETVACREAALTGRLAFLNTGTGAATVRIYGGTRPATSADAPGTTLLAQVDLTNPAGSVASGALTLAPLEPGMILATGSATWVRVVNRNAATAFDMDAGGLLSSAECKLSTVDLLAGGLVVLISAVLS